MTKVEIWRTTIYYTSLFTLPYTTLPKFFLPNFPYPTNRPNLLPTYYHTYILPFFYLLGCTRFEIIFLLFYFTRIEIFAALLTLNKYIYLNYTNCVLPSCGRRAKRSGSWSQLFRCAKKLGSHGTFFKRKN